MVDRMEALMVTHQNEKNFKVGAIAASVSALALLVGSFAVGAEASNNRTDRFIACIEATDRTPLECREAAH